MTEPREMPMRRILVAMDLSMRGPAALDAAARLALEMRAELQGLFVEDIDLFRLAGLPFAREIDDSSGILRPLDLEGLERTLRAKAEEVRRAIAETAQRTSLRWSFRIARGKFVPTMLTESVQADLLLIARDESSLRPPSNMRRGPIIAIDDGAPSNERVFTAAQCLARQYADTIVVLVIGEDERLKGKYSVLQPDCYVQRCAPKVESLLQAIRTWRPQLVLIRRSSPLAEGATVDALLRQLPCPLVLVQ